MVDIIKKRKKIQSLCLHKINQNRQFDWLNGLQPYQEWMRFWLIMESSLVSRDEARLGTIVLAVECNNEDRKSSTELLCL